jgi:hypothetical protein
LLHNSTQGGTSSSTTSDAALGTETAQVNVSGNSSSTPVSTDLGIQEPLYDDPSILKDAFLQSWYLVINVTIKAIICRKCGHGLDIRYVTDHLEDKHPELNSRASRRAIKSTLLNEYSNLVHHDVSKAYTPPVLPCVALSFIKKTKGFTCKPHDEGESCYYAAETRDSVEKHIRREHGSDFMFEAVEAIVQTLYNSNRRRFFPVSVPEVIAPGNTSLYMAYVERRKAMEKCNPIANPLEVHKSPFMRKHRWPEVIAEMDRRKMVDLADIHVRDRAPHEAILKDIVRTYVLESNNILGEGELHSELARRLALKDFESE